MVDKKDPDKPKPELSDQIAERIKGAIIHGTGYGRPPKEHQFKKGEGSPNARGRPRKAAPDLAMTDQPFLVAVGKSMGNPIAIKENGVVRNVSSREALVESVKISAIRDRNARAQGLLADWTRQADEMNAREIRGRNEFWSAYQTVTRQLIAESAARGEAEPDLLPHPEDIVIDPEAGPRFIGAFDETSKAQVERSLLYQEALLLQAGLDERLMPEPEDGDILKGPGTALEFAKVMNRSLPPRLRMTELRIVYMSDFYARHPLRWLLTAVTTAWRKLGKPRKRGELFPPFGAGLAVINLLNTLAEGALDGTLGEDADVQQFVELIAENQRYAQRSGWI